MFDPSEGEIVIDTSQNAVSEVERLRSKKIELLELQLQYEHLRQLVDSFGASPIEGFEQLIAGLKKQKKEYEAFLKNSERYIDNKIRIVVAESRNLLIEDLVARVNRFAQFEDLEDLFVTLYESEQPHLIVKSIMNSFNSYLFGRKRVFEVEASMNEDRPTYCEQPNLVSARDYTLQIESATQVLIAIVICQAVLIPQDAGLDAPDMLAFVQSAVNVSIDSFDKFAANATDPTKLEALSEVLVIFRNAFTQVSENERNKVVPGERGVNRYPSVGGLSNFKQILAKYEEYWRGFSIYCERKKDLATYGFTVVPRRDMSRRELR